MNWGIMIQSVATDSFSRKIKISKIVNLSIVRIVVDRYADEAIASSHLNWRRKMLKIVGDIHGKFDKYYEIASKSEATLQIGDFGFSSTWNKLSYSDLDPNNHKVLAANHDDYDIAPHSPHYLGDYGVATIGGVTLFYIRGGLSIDRLYRQVEHLNGGPKTYWTQEELSFAQMTECIDAYQDARPDIVVSHVPPSCFVPELTKSDKMLTDFGFHAGFRENTSLFCNELLMYHQPKLFISGHFHKSHVSYTVAGMKFVSLAELETYDILDSL
jgi:hypothetical protein